MPALEFLPRNSSAGIFFRCHFFRVSGQMFDVNHLVAGGLRSIHQERGLQTWSEVPEVTTSNTSLGDSNGERRWWFVSKFIF
jgi:hypothetical protein